MDKDIQEQPVDRTRTASSKTENVRGLNRLFAPLEGPQTIGRSHQFWGGFLIAVLAALVYPLTVSPYQALRMSGIIVWVFLALSLSAVWGYSGIFSFGQTAFFGIGGYTFGVVGINLVDMTGATNVALIAAIIAPAILAAFVGYFMFYGRVSGVSVAVITLAVTLILELIFSRTAGAKYVIGEARLGGFNGMTGIPSITFGYGSTTVELGPVGLYYFIVVLVVVVYLGLRYVVNSDYGYVMVAMREDEVRTEMFGYDVRKVKLQVFVGAATLGGLGGALYAARGNFISPPVMGLVFAALPVIWLTVGGRETLLGAVLATIILKFTDQQLASIGSEFSLIFMGLILLAAILLFPTGVVPTVNEWLSDRRAERRETGTAQQE